MKLRNAICMIMLGFLLFGANEVLGCASGAIRPSQRFDRAQAASTILKDLVLVGTVTEIYSLSAPRSVKKWAVVVHVDRVVSGEFSGTTFTFTIHSPSRAGLRVGRSYTIKATWTADGYVVDEGSSGAQPSAGSSSTSSLIRMVLLETYCPFKPYPTG